MFFAPNKNKNLTIGFLCSKKELGSAAVYCKVLFALKQIYRCRLVLFGNAMTQNLYSQCDFIDENLNIGEPDTNIKSPKSREQIATINSYALDYLIATDAKSAFIRFCLATNAKRVICGLKVASLLSWRTRTIPIYTSAKYANTHYDDLLLHFARRINPRIYDLRVKEVDFARARFYADTEAIQKVDTFLAKHGIEKPFATSNKANAESKASTSSTDSAYFAAPPPTEKSLFDKSHTSHRPKLILINPFNVNNPHTLPLASWLELIARISQNSAYKVAIATYPAVEESFARALDSMPNNVRERIAVFRNDANLLNLVALLEKMDCLISPSTGTIHIANVLKIPAIGLYADYDRGRWGHDNIRYVCVPDRAQNLTQAQCQEIIANTMSLVDSICQAESKYSIAKPPHIVSVSKI